MNRSSLGAAVDRTPIRPSEGLSRISNVAGIVDFADAVLPTLRTGGNGLFCFDRAEGDPALRGASVRYSLLVLLGLLTARASGRTPSIDIDSVYDAIIQHPEPLGIGDRSLLLWAETRLGAHHARSTVGTLEQQTRDQAALAALEGMEAAWFSLGAGAALRQGLASRDLRDRAYAHLLSRRSHTSPLFLHTGNGSWRSRFPNFATQIYTLLALAEAVKGALEPGAVTAAKNLADCLIERRRGDGGWPWLYDGERGTVLEAYEIYSVHQDAMAPMALLTLAEATGDRHYAAAAASGVRWCFGENELQFHFYDRANNFAHRSIKRRGAAHAVNLWANTALGGVLGTETRTALGDVEVNRTCRPYHLGWILEAWCGREQLHALVDAR